VLIIKIYTVCVINYFKFFHISVVYLIMSSWLNKSAKIRPRKFINNVNVSPHIHQNNQEINIKNDIICYEPYLFSLDNMYLVNNINRFKSKIDNKQIKRIVNVYKPTYKGRRAAGLGDFIRGNYCLEQFCNLLNIEFNINFNHHPISNILENPGENISNEILDNIDHFNLLNQHIGQPIHYISNMHNYIDFINSFINIVLNAPVYNNTVYLYIIAFPIFNITNSSKSIIQNSLLYNSNMNIYITDVLNRLNLNKKQYNVLHIRSGDIFILDKNNIKLENYSQYLESLIMLIKNKITNVHKWIIICDCNIIKNYITLKVPELIRYNTNITHLGEGNVNYENAKNSMLDFYICSYSNYIYSITCYQHGSGFSKWCASTYNIPYSISYCSYL
jgi:hypothetical protein